MRITFTPSPSKTIDEESDNIFPVIVNGSYFGRTASGSFFPAGLWQENEKIISQMDYTDPNLSHIVSYTYSGNIIAIEENSNYKNISCKNGCIAFQAGPLIASGGILISTYDGSWHAREQHERTILGVSSNHTPVIFIFTEQVSLLEAGKKILGTYPSILSLINLDGGPSTAFKVTDLSFRQTEKLPILLHIR